MALWYELASLPLKSVMKTLQSSPTESENARDRNALGSHSEPDFYTEVKNKYQTHHVMPSYIQMTIKEIFAIQLRIYSFLTEKHR